MADSKWKRRGSSELQLINGFGFTTTARDLARFGLMTLAGGTWAGFHGAHAFKPELAIVQGDIRSGT
ncbi:MAG: hypothetical protein E4H48_04825 [Syntrophobacterales bacterium]|jgi:hypothetical protein|nr:MAG: hypothetical protein E4H48_04825 [Syntrophobacterales bacterium]